MKLMDRLGGRMDNKPPVPASAAGANGIGEADSMQRLGRRRLTVAKPDIVPEKVSVCPECGGRLWWQFTTTDWLRDLSIDCENDEELSGGMSHRYYQSDWQPVIDLVRRWLAGPSPTTESCGGK